MPKDGLYSGFLPHIEGASARPSRTAPVTLELSHGPDKQVISLPTEHLDKNKRYYVTFTIKGGPQGSAPVSTAATTAATTPQPPNAEAQDSSGASVAAGQDQDPRPRHNKSF